MISLCCYIKGMLYVIKTQLSPGAAELARGELGAGSAGESAAVHLVPAKAKPPVRPEAALGRKHGVSLVDGKIG